jgi:AraC-like DNA-binding protein
MNTVLAVLLFIGIILSFPISLILFIINKVMKNATRLLAVAFFSIGCYALSHFLFLTEWILNLPIYYRLVTPLYYLIPPCIYLYAWQILRIDEVRRNYTWLHFLPAIIMLVDIIPWITATESFRYRSVHSIVVDHVSIFNIARGYIPIWFHFVARPLQGLCYIFFQYKHLLSVRKKHCNRFRSIQYQKVYRWVLTLSVVEMIMYLSLTGFTLTILVDLNNAEFIRKIIYAPAFLMCISFIVAAFYLYFTPNLLYGYELITYKLSRESSEVLPLNYTRRVMDVTERPAPVRHSYQENHREMYLETNVSYVGDVQQLYSDEAIKEYQKCLEEDLVRLQLFKRQGLTVHQLTKMCDIPSRALSYILGTVYKKRFNDFINEYRVEYIVKRLQSDDWRGLTLEGLAFEAGFSSRTTFFLAFKKVHNMSPSQYVNKIEKELYRGA